MTARPSLRGPALVAGLDDWGEAVAATVDAHVGDPLSAPLHVLVISESADPEFALRQLELEAGLLVAHEIPYLTVVQADDGVWVGPAVVPAVAGCTWCAHSRRRDGLGLVGLAGTAGRRGRREDDVVLAAQALVRVADRLLAAPALARHVVHRFRAAGLAADVGCITPVPGCARCDAIQAQAGSWAGRPAASGGATVCSLSRRPPRRVPA